MSAGGDGAAALDSPEQASAAEQTGKDHSHSRPMTGCTFRTLGTLELAVECLGCRDMLRIDLLVVSCRSDEFHGRRRVCGDRRHVSCFKVVG